MRSGAWLSTAVCLRVAGEHPDAAGGRQEDLRRAKAARGRAVWTGPLGVPRCAGKL